MPKIPELDIKVIKQTTDLLTLCQTRGIKLKKVGKNYKGRCPFHEEENASFTVNPSKNLWNCFGCSKGGDVIELVKLLDGCTFPEAVAKLLPKTATKRKKASFFSSSNCLSSQERSRVLSLVADFYHAAFTQQKPGKAYMNQRGLKDPALFSHFKVGFCAGNLRESIPQDGKMLEDLKILGVIKENGHEFFRNCVVFPIPDAIGKIVNLYGRRIRDGQVNHLYLPGPKQGVFNGDALKTTDQIILVESILDALAVIQAGYPGSMPCFGSAGIPDDVLSILQTHLSKSIFFCFDSDAAGRKAALKSRKQLEAIGMKTRQVILPDGHDPCSLLQEKTGKFSFKQLMRQAGRKTQIMGANKDIKPTKITWNKGKAVINFPDRVYELSGVGRDPSKGKIKIKVKPAETSGMFLDTVDLYSARSRSIFARSVAEIFGAKDAQISAELLSMIEPIDKYKEDNSQEAEADAKPEMTDAEKKEALSFLKTPDILGRISEAFESIGFTGEKINKQVGYLAAVSRKLEDPISVCIQSRSAAGKSALQDAILGFVPPEDVVRYTRLTGQALFYKEGDSLKHKIVAIEEAVGAEAAIYAIRTMQSANQVSVATAGRDPISGKMQTEENKVEGPTPFFMTTTAPEIESETSTRFAFLTMDESAEATARIQAAQRSLKTLEGLRAKKRKERIIRLHQNAQRLLETGLKVVIPFADHLRFPSENLRTRRDNMRYLSLIEVIAFLHQYQREIKVDDIDGEKERYLEATLEDVALANELACDFLGRSLDELSPPSRKLLVGIREMIMKTTESQGIPAHEITFTRRDIREYMGWTDFQVKTHINQLVDLEYIYFITGRKGKEYIYELKYDGDMDTEQKYLPGLVSVDELREKIEKSRGKSDLEGEK